jgi:chorismate synthase
MNSFGRFFKVEIFGESHGEAVGVVIDGCSSGIPLAEKDFIADLNRRKSGASGTTPRHEQDDPHILSGIYRGFTTGTPICIVFHNHDTKPSDYEKFEAMPRPGHADMTGRVKFKGFNDPRGSGHFSGRVTTGLVAAGTIAKRLLSFAEFTTRIVSAGGQTNVAAAVTAAATDGDSVGAVVEIVVSGLPAGLGEPFFDSAESVLSHTLFAVPGVRGVEFGDGFKAAAMRGSEHNDPFVDAAGHTSRNGSGGINGGITNGNNLVIRIAVKPTSTIAKPQVTYDLSKGEMSELSAPGRHDTCIALRSAVVLESAAAIAIADLLCADRARNNQPQI